MDDDAMGLAGFINAQIDAIPNDDPPVVYVQMRDGARVVKASMVRETLTDGSHVYNLILTTEDDV
jgi:hypothetical protein